MKPLRPIVVLTVGPVLVGVVFALVFSFFLPEFRTPLHIALTVSIGAAAGIVMLAPIAAGIAIRDRRPQWLLRLGPWVDRCASLGMVLSAGYLFAGLFHGVADRFVVVAWGVLFLGASVKVALSLACEQKKSG